MQVKGSSMNNREGPSKNKNALRDEQSPRPAMSRRTLLRRAGLTAGA
jgi:hypothetical protein